MNKKAIIYDLDNTLYSVKSLGEELLAPLFELIASTVGHAEHMDEIKTNLMGKPFGVVAKRHDFSKDLIGHATELLRNLTYKGDIQLFEDYGEIKRIPGERYLVTMGFTALQWSKIKQMGIEGDFQEIHVVDPDVSPITKKDVFADIMRRKTYAVSEMLVVGDDPNCEIKAAQELGIDTVLMDKIGQYAGSIASFQISNFVDLKELLGERGR